MSKQILVLGAGSVGKRHLKNLAALGARGFAMDPRRDRLEEAAGEVTLVESFESLEEISDAWRDIDGVVVASPPAFHVDQCIAALEQGKPVLLEKPVSPTLASSRRLADICARPGAAPLLLGYTYRWWEPLREFRRQIIDGAVGQPLNARFVMSAHLGDWHPWERYQDFFMASAALGGGALLDESHFVDLMLWFFGMPRSIYGRVEKISGLELDSDDNVDIVASYESGLRVYIHLDLYGRPHQKYVSVTGEGRTIEWSFEPNCWRVADTPDFQWRESRYDGERNDMFMAVASEFLDLVERGGTPSCTIADGVDVMRVVEACRRSTQDGREQSLAETPVNA